MPRFYFTYGTEGQPFIGGWTEISAPDRTAACVAFRAFHPDRTPGILNCSDVYDENRFKKSCMFGIDGNFGHRCHETIILRREAAHK